MKSNLVKNLLEDNKKHYQKMGNHIDSILKSVSEIERELKRVKPSDDMLERILKEMKDATEQFKRMNL